VAKSRQAIEAFCYLQSMSCQKKEFGFDPNHNVTDLGTETEMILEKKKRSALKCLEAYNVQHVVRRYSRKPIWRDRNHPRALLADFQNILNLK
jgi:hypothetical protein